MKLAINEQLYIQLLEPEHSTELYALMRKEMLKITSPGFRGLPTCNRKSLLAIT